VYVLDWGIARELDVPESSATKTAGTLAYMAPEQEAGADIDARADVFSLGCVLYEILTGAQLHPRRAPTREPRDDAPPELELVWRHATAPDRWQRTGSARELADAVQRYLDGDRDLAHRQD